MAMTSLQSDGAVVAHSKPRSRKSIVVKPILKKLHVHSHSARTSLDLDRGWDDQPHSANSPDGEYGYNDYIAARDADAFASERRHLFSPAASPGPGAKASSKPARDVSFTISAADLSAGAGVLRRAHTFSATSHAHAHARSTSGGASVASPVAAAGRHGSTFVHPFQQIPRTSTPPLSYANSDASLDTTLVSQQREHNSIAEDEGDEDLLNHHHHQHLQRHSLQFGAAHHGPAAPADLHLPARPPHRASLPYPPTRNPSAPLLLASPPVLSRRPSLTSSHRTSSQSDGNSSVRAPMTRSNSVTPVLHPAQPALNHSRSDLESPDHHPQPVTTPAACANDPFFSAATATNTATTTTATATPASNTTPATNTATTTPLTISCPKTVSPTVSHPSPLSPFRASLDLNSFRVRSRSDIDTHARQEQVREARRKFEAKEREKQEKYAREQVRKRERADAKQERQLAQQQRRKSSLGHASDGSNPLGRGPAGIHREKSSSTGCFLACDDSRTEDVVFDLPSRTKSARHRTTSIWTAFILWLRTRLIKLGRKKAKSG